VESNERQGYIDDSSRVSRNILLLFLRIICFDRLGRMKWKWEEFSIGTQKMLMEKCIVFLQEGNTFDLSSLLNAFQEMKYRWKENESVKQAILAGIVKNFGHGTASVSSGRGIANIIYYFGQSGIEWKDIPKQAQNSLFNGISHCYLAFNEQEIRNTIHG
jgi:hypothetical protein